MINAPLISPIYMGIVGLLTLYLSVHASRNRREHKVSTGDGDVPALFKAIRVHANLIENAPLALILLLAIELQGASGWIVHGLGLAFVVGRLLHAYGLGCNPQVPNARLVGSVITLVYLLTASLGVIAISIF
ncbi:MAG: putative membrane protein YecN with MAPEG domain [Granulosicoccus sp.]|jgi:uncharacterized membrane protein YecN with MAPEG domain